jgi:hypothetical protein
MESHKIRNGIKIPQVYCQVTERATTILLLAQMFESYDV